jgi:hypothetical protein
MMTTRWLRRLITAAVMVLGLVASTGRVGASSTGVGLTLSRTAATVGSGVTASGTGFPSGTIVDLFLDATSSPPLATTTTNSSGAFMSTFNVPPAVNAAHSIVASPRGAGGQASAALTVLASFKLRPRSAAPGATLTAEVNGYKAQQYVVFAWGSPTGTVLTVKMTDNSGHALGLLTVPATAPGTYTIFALGHNGGPTTKASVTVT